MKATISATILAKNEEKNIEKCLKSLSWSDEIIVIDDGSTDKTVEIAKQYKAKVYTHALDSDFSEQRNYGLSKATGEWILFIDSDEVITPSLQYEINQLINSPMIGNVGYEVKRTDNLWGKQLKYGETANVWLLRLAKKDSGMWEGKVHETWKVKGNVGKLKNILLHYPHQTVSEFLREINYYTDLRAEELYKKKVKVTSWQIVLYPLGKFFYNYIFRLGFLDGVAGMIIALMMSFHSFLVRGKLWTKYN